MTVGELRTKLAEFSDDALVRFEDAEWGPTEIERVALGEPELVIAGVTLPTNAETLKIESLKHTPVVLIS